MFHTTPRRTTDKAWTGGCWWCGRPPDRVTIRHECETHTQPDVTVLLCANCDVDGQTVASHIRGHDVWQRYEHRRHITGGH